jgi:hypothetical protein
MNSRRTAVRLALALALGAVALSAQLQTGGLYGSAADEQGQPLPGVTLTLSGVGADRVQTSDEEGRFRFVGLYPGAYTLRAELDGFATVEVPNVAVRVGGNSNVEVSMSAAAVAETITVTGERPLMDERQTNRGATLPAADLDRVPTARDPWSLLSQAPGVLVDRFNLGGNESGQQSNFTGAGSSGRDNVFAVDGVVLTDMNAVGASATYFDFGAFEEVQMTVSSADVTVATGGVTINQVTKRGTNQWRAQARYLVTDGEWQSDPVETADFRGNEIDKVEEYGADVGGPIVRDRAWIWASYGESDIRNIAIGGQRDTTQLEDLNTKLNFQAIPQLSGVLHYWTNDKLKFGRFAGPTRAPASTLDQTTPQDIYKIETSLVPSSRFIATALWARDDGIFTLSPQGGRDADIFRDEDGVLRGSNFDFAQEAVIDQGRLEGNFFLETGAIGHELKFGAGYRTQENASGTIWPRSKSVSAGENFGIDGDTEIVIFPRDRQAAYNTSYDSAWIQDTIKRDRWTINAGLRYDLQKGENDPTVAPANPFAPDLLPELDFRGNDAGGFEWESLVPRIGVTYALGAERETLVRGTFSQYAEQLGQLPLISRVNPASYQYAYFYFTDANHNLVFDPNEAPSLYLYYLYNIDPDDPGSLVTPNVNDPNLDPAMSSEVTFAVEQAFRPELVGSVTLTYRRVEDLPEERLFVVDEVTGQRRLATRDDYELVGFACDAADECAPLPNGRPATPTPFFDLRSGLSPAGQLYTNGDREQEYTGVTVAMQRRLSGRWSLRGHFTWADWESSPGSQFRRFDDPTDVVGTGVGALDGDDPYYEQSGGNKGDVFTGGRWAFNVNGLVRIAPDRPWGFNVGASLDGREGYISPVFVNKSGSVGRRSVQLTRDIEVFRLDDVTVLSAHLDKEFSLGETTLTVALDGFNLLDEDTVLQRDRNLFSGRANQTNETLSPRVFRLGATLRFR